MILNINRREGVLRSRWSLRLIEATPSAASSARAKQLAAWAKKFPDEFMKISTNSKLDIGRHEEKQIQRGVHYTRDLVYERIAPMLLEELERKNPPDEKGNRPNELHQWLTEDVGDPMLAQRLYSPIVFQRLAITSDFGWNRFCENG